MKKKILFICFILLTHMYYFILLACIKIYINVQ